MNQRSRMPAPEADRPALPRVDDASGSDTDKLAILRMAFEAVPEGMVCQE